MLNLKLLYRFQQQPFVLLFCAFASGILFAGSTDYFFQIPYVGLALLILFLGLEISGRLKGWLFTVFLNAVFFVLGTGLFQQSSSASDDLQFEVLTQQDIVYSVQIAEVANSESDWVKCIGKVDKLFYQNNHEKEDFRLLLFVKKSELPILAGDQLLISSKIERVKNKGNPGEFDAEKYWKGKGINYISFVSDNEYRLVDHTEPGLFKKYTDQLRDYCSKALKENFGGQEGAVLTAIVLGDKSMINDETRDSFMNTGAMHVLAVSGLHIGLILYLLLFIAERFSRFISRKTALIGVLIFLWIYAVITGLSPSVIRAVFMFSLLSISQLSSRNYSPINILFFTAFCLLIYDPLYLYDIGFQLSYLAMLGIFLFYEKIEKLISVDNWLLKKIWQGTAIGLAAQIMTTPISLYYFHQFPNYFILSNLGLMATSGLILGLGIAIVALFEIPVLVKPVAFILWVILHVTLYFLSWVEDLPGSVAYGYDLNLWQGLMLTFGSFILFFGSSMKHKLYLATPLILLAVIWMTNDRFQKMSKDEICVFAHSKPLIAVKKGGVIHCFYVAKSEKDLEKAEMIVESYAKQNPGYILYHPIKNQKINVKGKQLNLELIPNADNLVFALNDQQYTLVLKNGMKANDFLEPYRIGMPWVEGGVDYSLKEGAYRIQL